MSTSTPLPLSILDLVPVPLGMDAAGAVQEALRLAQEAEALGFARYC
ncbi:hypothetical protein [Deinococcus sp.]|nr:hypothetical protein [Deinococcus sp.]